MFNNRDHAPRLFSPRNIARSRPKEAALPSEITESPCFNLYFFIFNGRATDKKRRVEYSINRGRRTFRHGRERHGEKKRIWNKAVWMGKSLLIGQGCLRIPSYRRGGGRGRNNVGEGKRFQRFYTTCLRWRRKGVDT